MLSWHTFFFFMFHFFVTYPFRTSPSFLGTNYLDLVCHTIPSSKSVKRWFTGTTYFYGFMNGRVFVGEKMVGVSRNFKIRTRCYLHLLRTYSSINGSYPARREATKQEDMWRRNMIHGRRIFFFFFQVSSVNRGGGKQKPLGKNFFPLSFH